MMNHSRNLSTNSISFKIYADDVYCGKINYVEGQRVYKKSCGSDTTEYTIATNIRIEAAEGTYLTLCEVQVNLKS